MSFRFSARALVLLGATLASAAPAAGCGEGETAEPDPSGSSGTQSSSAAGLECLGCGDWLNIPDSRVEDLCDGPTQDVHAAFSRCICDERCSGPCSGTGYCPGGTKNTRECIMCAVESCDLEVNACGEDSYARPPP